MKRGFKAQAERLATELATQLGVADGKPIPPRVVARHLEIEVLPADDIVPRARLAELYALQSDAFSAGTFRVRNGTRVIVYNPLHEVGRTNSNIAHELAHVLLGHTVRNIETVGQFKFLTCDAEQEEEADWLAGCLLLPRPVVYSAAKRGWGAVEIATKYETSEQMARFRLNASGVLVQLGRARKTGSV